MELPCTKHILAQYRGLCPQCKESREEQRKVINQMTAKVIALEEYTTDIQKKVFPQVGGGEQLGFL
jgi:hypothetical protein